MRRLLITNLLSFIYLCIPSLNAQVVLFDGKGSAYTIVIPSLSSTIEVDAANLFQDYFSRITGFQLPVIADDQPATEYEIVIGNSNRLAKHNINIKQGEPGQDGFLIRTKKKALFISGETPQGTLNGVYTFLEEYLGCRFYSPGVMHIPLMEQVILPKIKDRQVPVFTYRELYFPGRQDKEYRAWHKLHTHNSVQWGMWVHTFRRLVPATEYFISNPAYFAEINGRRIPNGQLCLTQPEVYEVLIENLRKNMEKKPKAKFWSVSQNDNYLACQCTGCREAAEKLGGQSGVMIDLVNRVAAEFPDKVISTLAYQYTRRAPANVKPRSNVNIMLCSIECNRSQPIASDPSSASFVKDVIDWTHLTDNILIWDYVVQFRNYISPFPNLRVLQPNLEFFAKKDCRMMFQQGSGPVWSEFSELRSYMIAKLLWNPYQDAEKIIDDFLEGYYRSAAPFIKQYIERMHDELEKSGDRLWIYGYPYDGISGYLRPDLIREYERLFDQAEDVVAEEPEILIRVQTARLPLEFAILDISLHKVDEQLSWIRETERSMEARQDMLERLDTFVVRCNRAGIKALNEMGFTPEQYRAQITDFLAKSTAWHLALGKAVTMLTPFSPKYDAGGAAALTDGIRGINDYHYGWLGFEGEDMVAIIDMEKEITIGEISADFLQNTQAWIFLPKSLSIEYSADGVLYQEIGKALNIIPFNRPGSFIHTFSVPAGNINARFIRIRAESLKTCPPWHIGSGKMCWIFTDEIVVK